MFEGETEFVPSKFTMCAEVLGGGDKGERDGSLTDITRYSNILNTQNNAIRTV